MLFQSNFKIRRKLTARLAQEIRKNAAIAIDRSENEW